MDSVQEKEEVKVLLPELDLVEEADRITHELSLDDEEVGSREKVDDASNVFKFDPEFTKNEEAWEEIKKEILGEQLDAFGDEQEEDPNEFKVEALPQSEVVADPEKDLINLRRTIYLVIVSSVDHNECCHKLLKLKIREDQQKELCQMVLECCMQERVYTRFYGLLA